VRYRARLVDRTLVIVKPDGVERRSVGRSWGAWRPRASPSLPPSCARSPSRWPSVTTPSMPSGRSSATSWRSSLAHPPSSRCRGPENTWKIVRTLMGTTNPQEAAPGTIRGDLAIELTENLIHGSDSPESRPARSPCSSPSSTEPPGHLQARARPSPGGQKARFWPFSWSSALPPLCRGGPSRSLVGVNWACSA